MERSITEEESIILKYLLQDVKGYKFDIENLIVEEMLDGGMGSLYVVNKNKKREERRMNKSIIEKQFKDIDGVAMSISLNIDNEGDLFEIDIWRVDFNPILAIPKIENVIC